MLELLGVIAMLVIIGYPIATWLERRGEGTDAHLVQHTKEDWKEIKRREKTK